MLGGSLLGRTAAIRPFFCNRDSQPASDDEVLGPGGLIRCAAHAEHEVTILTLGRFMRDEAARGAKTLAMHCFASQLRPSGREPIVPSHVLQDFTRPYEVFLL
jgi:LmbE family N-acetylglucosaminyl deacetylase